MTLFYTCKKCEHEFEVEITPFVPAKTWGPPESCYPAEGGECDPTECPKCDAPVNQEEIAERASERERDYYED